MLEQLIDSAPVAAPLALTCAFVAVGERIRATRRRERLNRGLHELRRPLQTLFLTARSDSRAAELELALDALAALDREINGVAGEPAMRPVDARALVEVAVGRWRPLAARSGRRLELAWTANGARVVCAPAAIARALDNLIVNSLEHGFGPIRVAATARNGRLRLLVADGGEAAAIGASPRLRPRSRDPRRGHGLRAVADVAAQHGGRFAACRHRHGVAAVLELPLA